MEEKIKEAVLITPEVLEKTGWSMKGNAWYRNQKGITNYEGKWQKWISGKQVEIKTMDEL